MKLAQTKSVLIHVDKLEQHVLNLPAGTELVVYCTLGNKTLKSATAPIAERTDAPVEFESLLQYPYEQEQEMLFALREKTGNKELGRYVLGMDIFEENEKPTNSVRIKLRHEDRAIGFLDMKIKLTDSVIDKANSAKYVKQPKAVRSDQVPDEVPEYSVDAYDTNQLQVTVYKVQNMKTRQQRLTCTVTIGEASLTVPSEHVVSEVGGLVGTFDKTLHFPYKGKRFLHFIINESDPASSVAPIVTGELDLATFVVNRANVFAGCIKMEVPGSQSHQQNGVLFVRIARMSKRLAAPMITDQIEFTESYESHTF